jgi:hypothetical protein
MEPGSRISKAPFRSFWAFRPEQGAEKRKETEGKIYHRGAENTEIRLTKE